MATKTKIKPSKPKQMVRPPIVAVLGHVDHGKTTLLDAIRQTNVVAGEAGGITQHIGAYQIFHKNRLITFIDTPGHAAFTKMRSRGGQAADLVILVIAADAGVKPQTKESLKHIKNADVPFIVAINKVDIAEASVQKVKEELAKEGILVEGYGGDVVAVEVSAKKKTGLDELLEMVFLLYDMNPVPVDPNASLEALVIESSLDHRRGSIASLLIKNGQLKLGDNLVAQNVFAKVKAIYNDQGRVIKMALPGQPVEIMGFKQPPVVGSQVLVVQEKAVSDIEPLVEAKAVDLPVKTEDQFYRIVLKADTAGTLEAIKAALPPETETVFADVGEINESDILLAQAVKAKVIGFHVKTPAGVKKLAETEKIKFEVYQTIYELLEAIEKAVATEIASDEEILGKLEILAKFTIKKQNIAGCRVTEGQVSKGNWIRLQRDEAVIGEVKVKSLKKNKESMLSVQAGQECGLTFQSDLEFQIGDYLTAYRKIEV
ncbi:translation initiation factor IF-2 [Patescibacteria group bacterium]|nr:translation initiation factor IF-2 [Patescibacteria group bacterium]MBU1931076.1 translation initiation factor IF-2 [Patescibacteria group bacterium]